MADKKRTWVSIVVAILIIFVVLGIAIVGSAAFWFRRHINAQPMSAESATAEFEVARARFAGQQPLIELQRHDRAIIHMRAPKTASELQTLRVLAYDPRDGKLVRVSLPFWLLRLAPSSRHMNFGPAEFDFDAERMHLTMEDVERAGPGLLLDTENPRDGVLVLVWTE